MVVVKRFRLNKIKCKECRYAVILGDTVLCLNRLKTYSTKVPHFTHSENECIIGSKGEPLTDVSAFYKVLEIYVELNNTLKDLLYIHKILSNTIKSNVPLGSYSIGKNVVLVKEYRKKVLNTKKIKEILKKNGILEEFLIEKEVKYIKIVDKAKHKKQKRL